MSKFVKLAPVFVGLFVLSSQGFCDSQSSINGAVETDDQGCYTVSPSNDQHSCEAPNHVTGCVHGFGGPFCTCCPPQASDQSLESGNN